MPKLPEPIRERLVSEFKTATDRVIAADDLPGKLYYFSVFYGEASRQLNVHWDADLALMHNTIMLACQTILPSISSLPDAASPPADQFLLSIDEVSRELLSVFEEPEIDALRFFHALSRVAEIQYVAGGNGAYLRQKGMITL